MIARILTGVLATAAIGASSTTAPHSQPFGRMKDGRPVERIDMTNARGMRVVAITYGATITEIDVPDACGRSANVMLSLPDIAAYERTQRRWAGIVGRYAGRIGNARFELAGRMIQLEPGKNGVTLHGGSKGFDSRLWTARRFANRWSLGVTFSLDSPDGDQGFPGHLQVNVTYRLLRDRNELRLEYRALADADTVINLTNHGFLNLAGAGTHGLATHRLWIDALRYAEVDKRKIPTGRLLPVRGTALDFSKSARLDDARLSRDPLLTSSAGIDHSLAFSARPAGLRLRAKVEEETSGRRLDILTTLPSVQLNTGNGFDGSETGSEGIAYGRHDGFAFEAQYLPDSPNRREFPSTVLKQGQTYTGETIYRFSARTPVAGECSR